MQYIADILPLALTLFSAWCLWSIMTSAVALLTELLPNRSHRQPGRQIDKSRRAA